MTLEQQQALARARARLRVSSQTSAAEQIANDPISRGAREMASVSPAEAIAGSVPVRFALGAVSPFLGAAQLAANLMGFGEPVNRYLSQLEDMKRRGMMAQDEQFTGGKTDVAGFIGAALSPPFLKAAKVLNAPTLVGKVGQGAMFGAGAGASAPVTDEDNYWSTKGGQTLLGTLTGATVPAAVGLARGTAAAAKDISKMFTEKGAKDILTKYQGEITGKENLGPVIEALRSVNEVIPGGAPKASEALAKLPEGSPLVAHEMITSRTPGGVSAQFGRRILEQRGAVERALQERDSIVLPKINEAVDKANASGGVDPTSIIDRIDSMMREPGKKASDIVQKVLSSVKEKLQSIVDENGKINAKDLWTVRKEIGTTIKSYSKETANWDKKLASGMEKTVQHSIDDAIESAGGEGWKKYMGQYAARSKAVEEFQARRLASLRPAQRTDLAGGANVAETTRIHAPQMLSRPMMITNAILGKLGRNVESKIDPEAAKRYLNPEVLAEELSKIPQGDRISVVKEMMSRGYLPVLGATIQEFQ